MSTLSANPEFRGRGYARDLTTFLAAQILAAGTTPCSSRQVREWRKSGLPKVGFTKEDRPIHLSVREEMAAREVWRKIRRRKLLYKIKM